MPALRAGPATQREITTLSQPSAVVYAPQPIWLGAVVRVLEGVGLEIVGTATKIGQCGALVRKHLPDVFVTDASTESHAADLDLVRVCREAAPEMRVILLSAMTDIESVNAALKAGVSAYVFKTAHPQDIADAVRQAVEHSVYFPEPQATSSPPVEDPRPTEPLGGLTRRETEILALVAEGHSNARMAKLLHVTEQTVKFHLSNIYRKLNVRNRTEASRWAHAHGVFSVRDPG